MKITYIPRSKKSLAIRIAVASAFTMAMVTPAVGADSLPPAPINLVAPTAIPNVAPLPFTAVKAAKFTTSTTMPNLLVAPATGYVGDAVTISGTGLPVSATMDLTWSTLSPTWIADIQPNTVNYMGYSFADKFSVNMTTVTTDAAGAFTFKTKVPEDFGGIHDIYAVQSGVAIAHGGFQMGRGFTMSPKSGPIGTPITVTYTGMGGSLYTAGAAAYWDNHFAGEMQSMWTRGTAKIMLRASGAIGDHVLEVKNALQTAYLNVIQSPIPYTNSGTGIFKVTKDNGLLPAKIIYPTTMEPTVAARTMLTTVGLDPNSKAVATLSTSSGTINTKTTMNVTGLSTTGTHQIVWATVVGNRVNCTGVCWAYDALPVATVDVTGTAFTKELTIPDNLGGWHVLQVKKGDLIEAQIPFYLKQSILPFLDKAGKVIGMGIAKADLSTAPDVIARGQSGAPTNKFKAGEEFTISLKGVGWTQFDNTQAVTYDNSFVGYGCGFNSNGYVVIHLRATGAPGTHIIDLHPVMYTNQPSFANTPYGMMPVLTSDRDFPALALGYQIPSYQFSITVTK